MPAGVCRAHVSDAAAAQQDCRASGSLRTRLISRLLAPTSAEESYMKRLGIFAGALVGGALLSACGASHGISSPSAFVPTGAAPPLGKTFGTEKVLYSFQGSPDGQLPAGALTFVKGALWGTTLWGGSSMCADYSSSPGCGTVFELTKTVSGYTQLHSFAASGLGGDLPGAALAYGAGNIYGTTDWGGGKGLGFVGGCTNNNGCGTVFEMDPSSGKFKRIIHKFSGPDGFNLNAGVIVVGSVLYGAALGGGSASCYNGIGCGVVFRMTKGGAEKHLHDFAGGLDGSEPSYSPIDVNGVLYGTTFGGGGGSCQTPSGLGGCGTIYKVSTKNKGRKGYAVLYRFQGGNDGAEPLNLFYLGKTLYGTTAFGGGTGCAFTTFAGCGTIFKIDPNGKGYQIVYHFQGGTDGWSPNNLLTDLNGTLYGTTSFGGGHGCGGNGCGTVFSFNPSSSGYGIVYSFQGGNDSSLPNAGVIAENGALFGTATAGGGYGCGGGGCGTVYEVTP